MPTTTSPEETRPEQSLTPQSQTGTPGAVGTSGSTASMARPADTNANRNLPDTASSLPLMIFAALGMFVAAGAVRALRYGL